jgi:DNA-directed RNA polymerase subunit RPC12/RpoP
MSPPLGRAYGAGDRLKCVACGSAMLIKSRESHPERGDRYERQTFACPKCGSVATRDVYTPGAAGP